jgi:hypothetical protein
LTPIFYFYMIPETSKKGVASVLFREQQQQYD